MQTFRLLANKFFKTFKILKSIYKGHLQKLKCKIKMKVRMLKLSLGKKILQPKNEKQKFKS